MYRNVEHAHGSVRVGRGGGAVVGWEHFSIECRFLVFMVTEENCSGPDAEKQVTGIPVRVTEKWVEGCD